MGRFRYLRDPLFLMGCGLYAVNRWLLKPHFSGGFLHSHFNDLWLIPCALPPILWLHRQLGLRSHDHPPQSLEIVCHLIFWSVLFEWIGPHFVAYTTGDPLDVMAYTLGAIFGGLWWQRDRCVRILQCHEL
jgi:hypothetical protein